MAMTVAGRTVITTAGTRVQVDNTARRVLSILFKGRDSNTGKVYVGDATVSSTVGFELKANQAVNVRFLDIRISGIMSNFWVDAATNGDIVDWIAILWP